MTKPKANADKAKTAEEQAVGVSVLANDVVDAYCPNRIKRVSKDPDDGAAVKQANGTILYTPDANFAGTDTFKYELENDRGETSEAEVVVTVDPVNDEPTTNDDAATTNEDTSVLIDVLRNDSDLESGGLPLAPPGYQVAVIGIGKGIGFPGHPPLHGSATIEADHKITYRPSPNFNGTDTFDLLIMDRNGVPGQDVAGSEVTVTVNPINDAPVANHLVNQGDEDAVREFRIPALASDIDGDTLTFGPIVNLGTGVTVAGTKDFGAGQESYIRYTPRQDNTAADGFRYTVTDPSGATASADVLLLFNAANDPPRAVDDSVNVTQGRQTTVMLQASDPDDTFAQLTYAEVSRPAGAGFSSHWIGQRAPFVRYTPDAAAGRTQRLVYRVTDRAGASAQATVTFNITPNNLPPVPVDDFASIDEDTVTTIAAANNDPDPENDSKQVTAVVCAAAQCIGGASVVGGDVRYEPRPHLNGTDRLTYTVTDGRGASAQGTITVEVRPVEDPPETPPDVANTTEDNPVEADVLANDFDPEGAPVELVAIVGAPQHGLAEIAQNAGGDWVIRYRPDQDWNGRENIDYEAHDDHGNASVGPLTVVVAPVNDAPEAVTDSVVVNPATPANISVLANDTDIEGDRLTVTAVGNPSDNGGTVTRGAGGVVVYTAPGGGVGADRFTYDISDGRGGVDRGEVVITLRAALQAHPPSAGADAMQADEDSLGIADLLANDTDADDDRLRVVDFSQPERGQVAVGPAGAARYQPPGDYFGDDSFTYTIDDGTDRTSTATVSVTVRAVEDAPVAGDDEGSTDDEGRARIDVLDNDSDADGDDLSLGQVFGAANGEASVDGDGDAAVVIYQADPGFSGEDMFIYEVVDATGRVDLGVVTVDVRCTPDPDGESCNGRDDDCNGLIDDDGAGGALQRDCYSGPDGTLGEGPCAVGGQVCAMGGWSGCLGEVLPVGERCGGQDDDCDGSVDCDDADCDGDADCQAACDPVPEACEGGDDDCDGLIDCDDPDCSDQPDCALDCEVDGLGNSMGLMVWHGVTSGGRNDFDSSCAADDPQEATGLWDAPQAGTYLFYVEPPSDFVTLYALDGTCGGAELGCVTQTWVLGTYLELTLREDQRITLVAEASDGGDAEFDMHIQIEGEDCSNDFDEDGDAFGGCDDFDCVNEDRCQ